MLRTNFLEIPSALIRVIPKIIFPFLIPHVLLLPRDGSIISYSFLYLGPILIHCVEYTLIRRSTQLVVDLCLMLLPLLLHVLIGY